jgi:sulfide:quinone oxidoreductase
VGGIVAANTLRRLLPSEHRVVVMDRSAQHAFAASFPWVMVGWRRPNQVTRPLRRLVLPGVDVVAAEVRGLDAAARRVETTAGTFAYDYLTVALGADLAPDAVPGLAESAHTFYSLDGSAALRDALFSFRGGKVAVVVAGLPYKCPGAPHEGAMLVADFLNRRSLDSASEVHLYTPEPGPLPVAGPALGDMVRAMLDERGVSFHPGKVLRSVEVAAKELVFDGGERAPYDLLVTIPPHRAPRVLQGTGLTNDAGWVPVDRSTLQAAAEGVYAIGDVAAIGLPGRWKAEVPLSLPKAGVFAHAQAKVVAQRIAAQALGTAPDAEFAGYGYCMLEAGRGRAGAAAGDFFAEPSPRVDLRPIRRTWHAGRVLFEQWWLAPSGLRKRLLGWALHAGGNAVGMPMDL